MPQNFPSLDAWLRWMETLHPSEIDLGLARVEKVAAALGVTKDKATVITVAGTNGKGSCIATMEQLLLDSGLRVGSYTSPHMQRYNERVKIQQQEIDDQALCDAFELIDHARGETSLTYFEFGTLAALLILEQCNLDVWLLEVGLGGRLDAVNIIDPDIAVITSIDLDHEAWLGDTRELIAKEKLGILRKGIPCVCAEPKPTANMQEIFTAMEVKPLSIGHDFLVAESSDKDLVIVKLTEENKSQPSLKTISLPRPNLPLNSVAAALQVLFFCIGPHYKKLANAEKLAEFLRDEPRLSASINKLALSGRWQSITWQNQDFILDVAHNPAAGALLAERLKQQYEGHRIVAVVGMLQDKNITQTLAPLQSIVGHWCITEFADIPRSAKKEDLLKDVQSLGVSPQVIEVCPTVENAITRACEVVNEPLETKTTILVFGSFYTVAYAQTVLLEDSLS